MDQPLTAAELFDASASGSSATVRLTSLTAPDLLDRVRGAGLAVPDSRSTAFSPDREGQPDEEHLFVLAQAQAPAASLA